MKIPISEAIIIAIANLIDDAQTEKRKPSHYDLDEEIVRCRLQSADPISREKVLVKQNE